jgi:hypothetical protein
MYKANVATITTAALTTARVLRLRHITAAAMQPEPMSETNPKLPKKYFT